ncbi:hypothetical protein NL676_022576 [Syzygium grande]|nr:hypothetical protein NL676_022576 [Syzygium grande]
MVEGMILTVTLISLILNGFAMFYITFNLVVGHSASVLFVVMTKGMCLAAIFICRIAASKPSILRDLLSGLAHLTVLLAGTGMSVTVLCICMIAVIIALPCLGILHAFVLTENDQLLSLIKEILVMQRRIIRERRELEEKRKRILQELSELFPSVSYTSQGIGSKFRDCAICLNDFVEGEHCWVIPSYRVYSTTMPLRVHKRGTTALNEARDAHIQDYRKPKEKKMLNLADTEATKWTVAGGKSTGSWKRQTLVSSRFYLTQLTVLLLLLSVALVPDLGLASENRTEKSREWSRPFGTDLTVPRSIAACMSVAGVGSARTKYRCEVGRQRYRSGVHGMRRTK